MYVLFTIDDICPQVCSQVVQSRNGEMSCQCGVRRGSYASFAEKAPAPKPGGSASPVDKDYVHKQLETAARVGPPGNERVMFLCNTVIIILNCTQA